MLISQFFRQDRLFTHWKSCSSKTRRFRASRFTFGPKELAEMPLKEELMERMAESAKATCDYFGKHIVFLNVLRRMSVDCDCAGTRAAEPTIPDIGMLASTDILAIDQASCDLVWSSPKNHDLVERIESRHGMRQLSYMRELKMGNPQYELISID